MNSKVNRDEITRMAREAGFVVDEEAQQHQPNCIFHTWHLIDEGLERFANLVYEHTWKEAGIAAMAFWCEGWDNLPPPLQGPTVAETATTQQPVEQTPPSEYRRGYWDGFAIGKREGRIEAEDALAEPALEQNFCCRCGKRTRDIHTCTPP